jgi:hypothetical protein
MRRLGKRRRVGTDGFYSPVSMHFPAQICVFHSSFLGTDWFVFKNSAKLIFSTFLLYSMVPGLLFAGFVHVELLETH